MTDVVSGFTGTNTAEELVRHRRFVRVLVLFEDVLGAPRLFPKKDIALLHKCRLPFQRGQHYVLILWNVGEAFFNPKGMRTI